MIEINELELRSLILGYCNGLSAMKASDVDNVRPKVERLLQLLDAFDAIFTKEPKSDGTNNSQQPPVQ